MPNASLQLADFTEKDKERFWGKVAKRGPDECWLWTGAGASKGYGNFWINGDQIGSHVASLILSGRVLSCDAPFCLHSCDVKQCVNPKHLSAGTFLQNSIDARLRGRLATADRNGARRYPERLERGEERAIARLTDIMVADIRSRFGGGESIRAIARTLPVNRTTVARVCRRKTWAHLP